ncbi:MAG: RluA family pseudouridine synthase [Nitrospinaceae bacterium]|nr:RluA family pseudouridine synthase [Nitrospinaceae bacterium]NIR53258.1 RluA family pseudouridine synthase [Nitrospinaceae bacterium]NIS83656.1 RluA family pseudouridine synthase [Nitrospinaceae bacterium]NIT80445.1 RluA family pseudouridine synthase [Nitrospinaceae bacterium]NIU42783.1 RluA family pseudouridine synthase [Nitrospinaceae bacterium]
MELFEYDIDPACGGKRLDVFLAEVQADISRSMIKKLVDAGHVSVNGASAKAHYKLKEGDEVTLSVPDPEPLEVRAEEIPLNIVYEDDCLIVIDKAPGMVVHPAPGHSGGTLVNALLHHCRDLAGIGGVERPGIVHRLDKDTSGLVVVAKTETCMQSLTTQFRERDIHKVYLAFAKGTFDRPTGVINTPIGRHKVHRKKMAARAPGGREAETRYEVIQQLPGYAFVRLFPKTGRTHQLRVHLASLGHPILGDRLYGGTLGPGLPNIARQALHAHQLRLTHPATGGELRLESQLPSDMRSLLPEASTPITP